MSLFYFEDPAQQPPQAPGGTYHYDTHENASPPLEIAVAGCTILWPSPGGRYFFLKEKVAKKNFIPASQVAADRSVPAR